MIAIVDSGPLYAAVDADDRDHARCVEALERSDLELVVPGLVVAEVAYMVGRRMGPVVEAGFLRGLAAIDVELPDPADWERIGELVEEYADFPLGGTDASVVCLAERLETDVVITLDTRHFAAVRTRHTSVLRLLPE
jgi:predicted nucleic acid-binding protein